LIKSKINRKRLTVFKINKIGVTLILFFNL
jgi:hypothetical protein